MPNIQRTATIALSVTLLGVVPAIGRPPRTSTPHKIVSKLEVLEGKAGLPGIMTPQVPCATVQLGPIDNIHNSQTYDCDVAILGNIDNHSDFTLESRSGNIVVYGKVDGVSTAHLIAAKDIMIAGKVDGRSALWATAQGNVMILDKIDGGSQVHLSSPW